MLKNRIKHELTEQDMQEIEAFEDIVRDWTIMKKEFKRYLNTIRKCVHSHRLYQYVFLTQNQTLQLLDLIKKRTYQLLDDEIETERLAHLNDLYARVECELNRYREQQLA